MSTALSTECQMFAAQNDLFGLTEPTLRALQSQKKGYTLDKGRRFLTFQARINRELLKHPVITQNHYTAWFEKGEMNEKQLKDFVVQFSVFSNLFLVAQLNKMLNADSLDSMRASKEILANEIGVVFNRGKFAPSSSSEVDPEIVSETGTVEGGVFHFRAGHFEWLLRVGEALGLGFNQLGKRQHGTASTLFFCDELARLYGNENYAVSQAASYAVENWANAGFWKELIQGFKCFNQKNNRDIPIGFFTWHDKLEAQHALHTQEELEEYYFESDFNEDAFIQYGNEMMAGINAFWTGLDTERKN